MTRLSRLGAATAALVLGLAAPATGQSAGFGVDFLGLYQPLQVPCECRADLSLHPVLCACVRSSWAYPPSLPS